VSAIELALDPAGVSGVAVADAAEFAEVLDGVLLDLAPISLDAGEAGLASAQLLADFLKGKSTAPPAFNLDPIGWLMRAGGIGAGDLAAAARFASSVHGQFAGATFFRADGRPVHEAGGSEAQELAAALGAGVAYLRALTEAGLSVTDAGAAIQFALAIGPDVLVETAKLRALRLMWARVMAASGAKDAAGARIHAATSLRMMSRRDAWTNILRTTAATFAAACGGADAITVHPLTEALGLPTAFARRIARNTQLILMEESRLGHVIDPGGGAWAVEKLTQDLAQAAWVKFQSLEKAGGLVATLQAGDFQTEIAAAREAKRKLVASRRAAQTGVTDFPLLNEKAPEFIVPTIAPRAINPTSAQGARLTANTLTPVRWAEPFELLRDRAEDAGGPKVFFANLGPLAEFSPRSNFAQNLFAAGGVSAYGAEAVYKDLADLAVAMKQSGCTVAVLCASDTRLAAESADAAKSLKLAGCTWLIHAGKPADEAAVRAKGFDQFIFAGGDALAMLETLHAALGIA
jgi:methylmalonyl-CoA mutase